MTRTISSIATRISHHPKPEVRGLVIPAEAVPCCRPPFAVLPNASTELKTVAAGKTAAAPVGLNGTELPESRNRAELT